jgi:hypothetical protein
MIRFAALLAGVIFACAAATSTRAESITFEREVVGIPPSDFDSWGTGDAGPGLWAVVSDESVRGGHAFEQYRNEPTQDRVPLAIYKPFSGANLEVELRFKPISGSLDQSVGIAVRLTTPDDYYVARASVLAQDVPLYRVARGVWKQLASASARVTPKDWHILVLKAEGDRFSVALNGQPLLTATDATFGAPGKIAFWTKADSVTRFDHLEIKPLP